MSGDETAAREWRAAQERVCALVLDVGEQAMTRTVPATPDWTALDLLRHVVGVDADVLGGDEADDHDAGWTQGHVDARAGASAAEVVAEWRSLADALTAYVAGTDARPLGDLVIHEQDLRGALGRPGARDSGGLGLIREQMAGQLAEGLGGRPPLAMAATDGDWSWRSDVGEPGAVLRAPAYDLFRALTSRRTAGQLRAWTVAGDVTGYLDDLAQLGPLPTQALPE